MFERIGKWPTWKKVVGGIGVVYGIWWGTGVCSMLWSCKTIFKSMWDMRGYDAAGSSTGWTDLLELYYFLLPWKLHQTATACDFLNAFRDGF